MSALHSVLRDRLRHAEAAVEAANRAYALAAEEATEAGIVAAPTTDTPDWRAIARDLALAEAAAIARDVRRRELDLHQCSFDEMPEANRTFVYGADRAAEHIDAAISTAPSLPTREQVAAVFAKREGREYILTEDLLDADAVLALLQKGADR